MTCVRKITTTQAKALQWLNDRGGTGVFGKDGHMVIASGEEAPHERKTWIALRDAQRITIDGNRINSLGKPDVKSIERNATDPFANGRVAPMPGAE